METRAHHLLIGAFALGITAMIFAFVIWLSKSEMDANWREYKISFEGSVSGLKKSADVLYNGLKVGEVLDLRLDQKDPNKVIATIRVSDDAPVTADSVATLESQGLTGLSTILISGGDRKSKALEPAEGEEFAFIKSKKSTFQEIFADAPSLLRQGNELLGRLNTLVERNQSNIDGIMANAKTVSEKLVGIGDKVDHMTTSIDELAVSARDIVKNDAKRVMTDVQVAASEAKKVMGEVRQMVSENRPSIREFTKNSLPEVFFFVADSRQLIATLDRFAQRLERSPGSILFGEKAAEYGKSR
jgi:phospholipid/cholesterol/gamma-HCH transport system substrate-binding protein